MTSFRSVLGAFVALALLGALPASADLIIPKKPTDYFVRFKRGVDGSEASEIARRHSLRIVWRSRLVPGLYRVAPARSLSAGDLRAMEARSDVAYFEPNYRQYRRIERRNGPAPTVSRRFEGEPNDPMYAKQWALVGEHGIHPQKGWEKNQGNADVRVAILDTGIDSRHPELADRVLPGYDFIDRTKEVKDTHGHGTHVSGIIGAKWNNDEGVAGINREVRFIPIRVVPNDGDETDANLVEAFEFAVVQGARVANCSFGKRESSTAVGDVIEAAGKKGLLVVVAAGNDGSDINKHPTYPASFQRPNMIVVASSTSTGGMSGFSNYGMGKVDVGAPGSNILSSVLGGYASWSGTSMATPQVVGVAALALSANKDLTPYQVRELILKNVDPKGAFKDKINTGGVVNASRTLGAALRLRRARD